MSGAAAPPAADVPLWRKALPVLVGACLVAFVLSRIDFDAFVSAIGSTHYLAFFGFTVVFNLALLSADAGATAYAYRRTVTPISFGEVFIIRGASYLPSALNHNVGQAWLTYFVSKAKGAPLWRVVGATLVVYATTFACLVVLGVIAVPLNPAVPWLTPTIGALVLGGLVYLGVIRFAPEGLRKRQATAPLFELGVRGHLEVMVTRLPHIAVQFLGAWLPFLFFGVSIPLTDALALMPVLMLAVTLPITPQGVGTRDVVAVELFASYAGGAAAEQQAAVAATTLTWAATLTLVQLVVSPLFMRRAYKLLEEGSPEAASATAPD